MYQPDKSKPRVVDVERELQKISEALNGPLQLTVLYAAPTKPREGWLAVADGTTWNPGGGDGVYIYRDSQWLKLFDFGANTVWTDIDFPIIIRTAGANIPVLTTVQGNIQAPQWAVNDYAVCEGQELIHQWKEGSDGSWHIHLITNGLDATDRYVKFELEWFWVNPNAAISASATLTSAELLIPANTTTKTMKIFSLGTATLTGGKIGGHVYARLRRIASVGTAPTNAPWVTMLQMHVECDSLGSRSITTK